MFICHKCGYQDFTDNKKTNCPICGTNVIVPKFALILFLSLIAFIIFTFLSVFEHSLNLLSTIFLILAVIMIPFAIMEAIESNNEIKGGFRSPDYPSEIISGNPRISDFKTFNYIHGLKDDAGVKNILIEVHDNSLNFYYNKLKEIVSVSYSEITGLELHEENELKFSASKSIIYAALLSAMGGIGTGIAGGVFGGIKNTNRYVLEIQIQYDYEIKSLYITAQKSKLKKLAADIKNKCGFEH